MEQDIRHITQIVNDVEDRQKEDAREIFDELKAIEQELELNIKKAFVKSTLRVKINYGHRKRNTKRT